MYQTASSFQTEMFRRHLDTRTKEDKELEECSFKPRAQGESPFISERTLRKYEQLQRRKIPPPPFPPPCTAGSIPSPVITTPKSDFRSSGRGMSSMLGGTYTKENGLVRGLPAVVGLSMFYFDPFSPPNFIDGTYGTSTQVVTVEEMEVTEEEPKEKKSSIAAPPLPSYLNGGSNDGTKSAAKKIVIVKSEKKDVVEEVTGWQAVLAEMERRKNGGMKKVPKPEPKSSLPEKRPAGGKKKPKDFKDIMDELNYKLAVLRGGKPVVVDSFV
jgi:hypothetical protein